MEDNKILPILIIVMVTSGTVWFLQPTEHDTVKTQRERIEILEMAKSSSDPAVLKQAELVRRDIEQDYAQNMEKQTTASEPESLEFWPEIRDLFIFALIMAVPLSILLFVSRF